MKPLMQFDDVSVGDFLPLGNVLAKLFHLVYLLPPHTFLLEVLSLYKKIELIHHSYAMRYIPVRKILIFPQLHAHCITGILLPCDAGEML